LNGEGVALGSDLSDIGLRLDAVSLLESLLDPSAIITPGYETWLVVDDEENEHVGVLSRETEESVRLRDAKNNEMVIPKTRIRQRRQVPVSLMPAGLQQSLTRQDLVDLWWFLQGCRQPTNTSSPAGATFPAVPQ
jgi:putative heme-binding domain-containing protein